MELATGRATGAIWAAIEPIHARIRDHPFLTGLTVGSLPHDAFGRYVAQDALYMTEYARALALCGARAEDADTLSMFCARASTAVAVERALHGALVAELGLDPVEVAGAEMTPTCLAYTSFIKQACALGERSEAVASVLPCYWIYHEVGRELVVRGSPDPVYARWLEAYASDEFDEAVRGALTAADLVALDLGPDGIAGMVRHALVAARYEWMFWDSAYRDERWPTLA